MVSIRRNIARMIIKASFAGSDFLLPKPFKHNFSGYLNWHKFLLLVS